MLSPQLNILMPLLFFVSLLFAHPSSQAAINKSPHWHDKNYIEYSFYDVALRGEHEVVRPVIKKWREPLRVWVSSTAGNMRDQHALLASHLKMLTDITQLPIQSTQQPQHANVRIFFTHELEAIQVASQEISPTAAQHLKQSICLGHIRYNQRAEITQATVIIPVQRAEALGKLSSCIVEELTQMLGLINDSKVVHPTVFNDYTHYDMLTGLDYLLLKLLYSPEIKAGMTFNEAAPWIRQRLNSWERNGLIRHASLFMSQHGEAQPLDDTI